MRKTIGIAMIVMGAAWWVLAAGGASPATQPATQPTTTQPTSAPAQAAKELTLDLGNKVSMKLILIPAGKFLMGSPDSEPGRNKDEGPQHEVTIREPFYMGVTHVTVDQFALFVKDTDYKTDAERDEWSFGFQIKDGKPDVKEMAGVSWRSPSFDQKGDHPVVQVSWNDARAFCDWLSKKSGRMVVLPTEAQWEYACRAGTKTAYPWGDDPDGGKGWANGADQSFRKKCPNVPAEWTIFSWDDGFVFTSPAGSFKANAFGLFDMNGNALQWCQDRYGDYDKGAATEPAGADKDSFRVVRGGYWGASPGSCRSAVRSGLDPGNRVVFLGFRVVVLAAGVDLPSPGGLPCLPTGRRQTGLK